MYDLMQAPEPLSSGWETIVSALISPPVCEAVNTTERCFVDGLLTKDEARSWSSGSHPDRFCQKEPRASFHMTCPRDSQASSHTDNSIWIDRHTNNKSMCGTSFMFGYNNYNITDIHFNYRENRDISWFYRLCLGFWTLSLKQEQSRRN